MSLAPPDSLVFDIGANTGGSAHKFLAHGAGHIVSVEPCVENWLVLQRYRNVTPILAAAWSSSAILPVSYAFNQPGLSSVQREKWSAIYADTDWSEPRFVPAITLDILRARFGDPHIIKIDVEGSELEVLRGLSARCPVLFFEFHWRLATDTLACLHRLAELGFTRAHYVREDIDLDTVPTTLLADFEQRWLADAPEWGNITVV